MTLAVDDADAFERSSEKTRQWIEDTAFALGTDDRHEAHTRLKAVLHALRDGMTVEAARQLAAELPDRLRWAFYEGWVPSSIPVTYRDRDEFLRRVAGEAELAGPTLAACAVASVMTVLTRHVSAPELDRVLGALPGQVRCLFELTVRSNAATQRVAAISSSAAIPSPLGSNLAVLGTTITGHAAERINAVETLPSRA